jgi:hypothetical protein
VFPNAAALSDGAHVTFVDASGGRNNASGRWASLMGMLGFATSNGGNGVRQGGTQVIDQSGGKDSAAAAWLAAYFGVNVITKPPPTPAPTATGTATTAATPAAPAAGITVVLGTAEEQAFLGDPGVGN